MSSLVLDVNSVAVVVVVVVVSSCLPKYSKSNDFAAICFFGVNRNILRFSDILLSHSFHSGNSGLSLEAKANFHIRLNVSECFSTFLEFFLGITYRVRILLSDSRSIPTVPES